MQKNIRWKMQGVNFVVHLFIVDLNNYDTI